MQKGELGHTVRRAELGPHSLSQPGEATPKQGLRAEGQEGTSRSPSLIYCVAQALECCPGPPAWSPRTCVWLKQLLGKAARLDQETRDGESSITHCGSLLPGLITLTVKHLSLISNLNMSGFSCQPVVCVLPISAKSLFSLGKVATHCKQVTP